MYKKRFAKWGFQKNSRRSNVTSPTSKITASGSPATPCLVPPLPTLGDDEISILFLMTSVRAWSESFYESVKTSHKSLTSNEQSSLSQGNEANLTFKLAIDMLSRGRGSLAGRVVRKAFLLVEEMLKLEGPACLWNMLEMIHHMVASHHFELCRLLVAHLAALIRRRKPKDHPLQAMVRAFQTLVKHLPDTPSAYARTSPVEGDITNETRHSIHEFLSIIQQAWTLNAVILFNNFDHRLFQLYVHIHWETCSIEPPAAIAHATTLWINQNTQKQNSGMDVEPEPCRGLIQIRPFKDDRVLQHLFTTPVDPLLCQDYDMLCMKSITALKENADFILRKGTGLAGSTTALLRILAGLATAKAFEEWCAMSETGNAKQTNLSRGQAGIIAIAIRTSLDLYLGSDGQDAPLDEVGQLESIVALRDYANADADLQVIQEMWLLDDALVLAGDLQKALEVRQLAVYRLESYFKDIPVDSV